MPDLQIGNVETGSEHPVRLQTMTTTGALRGGCVVCYSLACKRIMQALSTCLAQPHAARIIPDTTLAHIVHQALSGSGYTATADTRDVAGTVEQVKRCVDAGAEIVRITVQGKKEAAACMAIREALFKDG